MSLKGRKRYSLCPNLIKLLQHKSCCAELSGQVFARSNMFVRGGMPSALPPRPSLDCCRRSLRLPRACVAVHHYSPARIRVARGGTQGTCMFPLWLRLFSLHTQAYSTQLIWHAYGTVPYSYCCKSVTANCIVPYALVYSYEFELRLFSSRQVRQTSHGNATASATAMHRQDGCGCSGFGAKLKGPSGHVLEEDLRNNKKLIIEIKTCSWTEGLQIFGSLRHRPCHEVVRLLDSAAAGLLGKHAYMLLGPRAAEASVALLHGLLFPAHDSSHPIINILV